MSLHIVSDLHIWGDDDPLYHSFLDLFRHQTREGDTVVLAGDLFDVFIGDKTVFTERYREFFVVLKESAERGVKIHYIEGNHDFMLRRVFRGIRGMEVHSDEVRLDLAGRKFLCIHGDQVDRQDYGYLLLRAFFRSPLMKLFITLMPGRVIEWIGSRSSHYSRGHRPRLPHELPIERFERMRNLFRSFAAERLSQGFDHVIMGHCHDLDEMSFILGGRQGQYVNMGFPRVHGSYLTWSPGEEKVTRERMPSNPFQKHP